MSFDQMDTSSSWDAFLSYSSHDGELAARVQRFLERYRLPDGRRLNVYRDETDIVGGELPEQLREALARSGCLVVCCSKAAANSDWVAREIEAFRSLAPDRRLLPVLLADDPPANIPAPLRNQELRWSDIRNGWRLGWWLRSKAREELVRVVAAAAGMDFRELLPLDRQRRRRITTYWTVAILAILMISASVPVEDWGQIAQDGPPIVGCDTLDDGIVLFRRNERQAVKSIVTVQHNIFQFPSQSESLGLELIPRGRLLPASIAGAIQERCGGSEDEWVGEPEPRLCVRLSESAEFGSFDDPMGGGEAALTDVAVRGELGLLDRFWSPIEHQRWIEQYGRRMQPSNGLPIAAMGSEIWLGFPDNELTRGHLWRSTDSGKSWVTMQGITDVRSIRHLGQGSMVAARRNRVLGFYLFRSGVFEPFEAPGKGDQLEVCGEVDDQPVLRTDRNVYRRLQRPWWLVQLGRSTGE